jgi:hypothetical protein
MNPLDNQDYQLLARLQQDCEYYLGAGGRHKKHLWALDEALQIQRMKELYESLPAKPDWLTLDAINGYEEKMMQPKENNRKEGVVKSPENVVDNPANPRGSTAYWVVAGLSETVIFREPRNIPLKELRPALTKIANHYGGKQKDICDIDPIDWTNDVAIAAAAFSGSGAYAKCDLWDWNEETKGFDLFRTRPLTRQMEMAEGVRKFANAYPEGNPGNCDPAKAQWQYVDYLPLSLLGEKAAWLEIANEIIAKHKQDGIPIVRTGRPIILKRDSNYYVWSGHTDIALSHRDGNTGIRALVGEVKSPVHQYDAQTLNPTGDTMNPQTEPSGYVVLSIDSTDNAAFVDIGRDYEIAKIVNDAASTIEKTTTLRDIAFKLRDTNGNTVGKAQYTELAPSGDPEDGSVRLSVQAGNAAFSEDGPSEVARILHEAAAKVRDGEHIFALRDYNGNTVGKFEFREQPSLVKDGVIDMTEALNSGRVYKADDSYMGIADGEHRYVVTTPDFTPGYKQGEGDVWLVNAKGEIASGYEEPQRVREVTINELTTGEKSDLRAVAEGRVSFEDFELRIVGDEPELG